MNKEIVEYIVDRKALISANRSYHHYDRGNRVRKLRKLVEDLKIDYKFNKFKVVVYVCPPTRRRLDPANFYGSVKPVIDQLTDNGWWEDDDWQHLDEMSFKYGGLSEIKSCFKFILEIQEVE